MSDPNADLIGYQWWTPATSGVMVSEVIGTNELLSQYVTVKETLPGGGEYTTIRPTAVVRRHKQITEGERRREDSTAEGD